jgi:hypothetical protein
MLNDNNVTAVTVLDFIEALSSSPSLSIGHSDSKFDSKSLFDSLNATSQFMAMAINRSQDFMKARYICIYMGVYVYMYIYVHVCVCVYI